VENFSSAVIVVAAYAVVLIFTNTAYFLNKLENVTPEQLPITFGFVNQTKIRNHRLDLVTGIGTMMYKTNYQW
jgi:hypothetical protein